VAPAVGSQPASEHDRHLPSTGTSRDAMTVLPAP
jgi:hypothetical protein